MPFSAARMDSKTWLCLTALISLACERSPNVRTPPRNFSPEEIVLQTGATGLSGLTEDGNGYLWAVAESADAIIRINPTTFEVEEFPISGARDDLEFESLTATDNHRFAIGTETEELWRRADALLLGEITDGRLEVVPGFVCDYDRWALSAYDNHGVEGLCYADGNFIVAIELVGLEASQRWAPVGVHNPETGSWLAHRLQLTTGSGKLSAIDCKVVDGRVLAMVVERHFGVLKILRVTIPMNGEGQRLVAAAELDLSRVFYELPNIEGIAWRKDNSVVLLVDNQYRGDAIQPSRIFIIPAELVRKALLRGK